MTSPKVTTALANAERKAWDSLSRYKFLMFGYHAAQWVLLNQVSDTRSKNPFAALVALAKEKRNAEHR